MRKHIITIALLSVALTSLTAHAAISPSVPFENLRECVMNNDPERCRAHITPASVDLFNRFASYNLLICLPTNWTVESEKKNGAITVVTASMPASSRSRYITRLVFSGDKLDLPATLRLGMGEKWQNRIQLSEQLYLMMKQNMGDKLTCDTIASLVEPKGK